jgi:hypothetical protein
MTAGTIARLAGFGLAGLALGGASLAALRLNVSAYLGGAPWRSAAAHLARMAILIAILAWAARQGGGPLLALAGGLVTARPLATRLWGRRP